MSTPTPRTDAAYLEHRHWANEDEATEAVMDFRDFARKLEAELAEQQWLKESALKRAKELTEELAELKESVLVQQIFSDDRIRANEAERELAAERARLRQLALDACRDAAIVPLVWYPTGYCVNPNDLGKINKKQVDACVAAIDAAMKEETK